MSEPPRDGQIQVMTAEGWRWADPPPGPLEALRAEVQALRERVRMLEQRLAFVEAKIL